MEVADDDGAAEDHQLPPLLQSVLALFGGLQFRVTLTNLGVVTVLASAVFPDAMAYLVLYPLFRLVFGTLYPAYASYKAVRTKNVKEYVKWMMYWIVYALFTCAETFTDVFLSFWFPFYYEIKIILVLWLLSPATKGSSILYRKFVHPMLSRREQEIDEYIAKAKEQGYHTVLHLGTKGVNYATTVIMQTAIRNLNLPSVSSHNLLPPSESNPSVSSLPSRTRTSSAPTEEADGPVTTKMRRRSRSVAEVKQVPVVHDCDIQLSDREEPEYIPSKSSKDSKPDTRPNLRSRKAKKSKSSSGTRDSQGYDVNVMDLDT